MIYGAFDPARTMSAVPGLAEGGITDFQVPIPIPEEEAPATELLKRLVSEFREAQR